MSGGGGLPPVSIVGLLGAEWFGQAAEAALRQADVVIGSGRLLGILPPDVGGKRVELAGPLAGTLDLAAERRALGERVCLLASGDPGFFGIVRVTSARFGPDSIEVHPAPSSVAMAFARAGTHWDDALVVSAHGRPLAAAVDAVLRAPKAAVLTAPDQPPEALGRALLDAGCGPRRVTVCARLGHDDEAVIRTDLDGLAGGGPFPPLAVVVLEAPGPFEAADSIGTRPAGTEGPTGTPLGGAEGPAATRPAAAETSAGTPLAGADGPAGTPLAGADGPAGTRPAEAGVVAEGSARPGAGATLAWGLPEDAFDHRAGMITKAEVRAVALGKLALPAAGVLWDVGAGSGSVAIECARLAPGLRVFAVERDGGDVERLRGNAIGTGVVVVHGEAPAVLAGLPAPDRVFVGGGGLNVLESVMDRLRPGGVVVATYAALDRAAAAADRLGHVVQIAVSRGAPLGGSGALRLAAENPVFVCWGPGA